MTANGTYSLEVLETNTRNTKALKILKSIDPITGVKTWYYIEYRQAIGFDRCINTNDTTIGCYPYLDAANILNGVIVHVGEEGGHANSHLLDMTPNNYTTNSDGANPALPFGNSFYDPGSGVTITALSGNGTTASVGVSFGTAGCQRFRPTLTLSPNSDSFSYQKILPGGSFDYTLTVKNNDSGACGDASFRLDNGGYTLASGWSSTFGVSSLTLAAGGSASTSLRVSAPSTAVLASIGQIPIFATHSVSSSISSYIYAYLQVSNTPSLSMTLATDKATYLKGQTVSITGKVSLGSSAASGTAVTITITKPNGVVVTKSASAATSFNVQ